jgi:hypothetical protein
VAVATRGGALQEMKDRTGRSGGDGECGQVAVVFSGVSVVTGRCVAGQGRTYGPIALTGQVFVVVKNEPMYQLQWTIQMSLIQNRTTV